MTAILVVLFLLVCAVVSVLRGYYRHDRREKESIENLEKMFVAGKEPPGTHWEDGYLVNDK